MNYSDQQKVFLGEFDRHVIALAIPGAGKTTTLVGKMYLIMERGETVTAVSFTNEAADSLQEKTLASIPHEWHGRCRIGTFHSLALDALRAIPGSPVQGRAIMGKGTTRDQRVIAIQAVHLPVNNETLSWFDIAFTCLGDPYGRVAAESLPLDDPGRAAQIELAINRQKMIQTYEEGLRQNRLFDVGLILLTALKYVERGHLLFDTDHLLVDEFQDVDEVQLRLIILLARRCRVDVVGDDDQSVYKFRYGLGYRAFPALAAALKPRWIFFTSNYRCKGGILQWAERVIERNQHRYAKKLIPTREPGGELRLIQLGHDGEENLLVANLARKALDEGAKTVAIIARANAALVEIQSALTSIGLEFHRVRCDSLWEVPPCSAAIALLESMAAPYDAIVGLEHALYLFGAHGSEIALLRDTAEGRPIMKAFEALRSVDQMSDGCRAAMDRLASLLRRVGYPNAPTTPEHAESVLSTVFEDVDDAVICDHRIGEKYRAAQCEMLGAAERILMGFKGTLAQRLAVVRRAKENSEDVPVTLTTMHSAKGLQFDAVFIVRAADHVIPGRAQTQEDREEERRLLYVAMTRARDALTVTCAKRYGLSKWARPAFMTQLLNVEGSPPEECSQDYEWLLRSRSTIGRRAA